MEGLPMVSYSTGSMNSLLHKLTGLKDNTAETEGLPRDHVEGLLSALTRLNGDFVEKVAGRQETDGQVKAWMKQIRQLVVDIEDWVDPKLATTTIEEVVHENLEDFILQIGEACERCARYELVDKVPTDPGVPVNGVRSRNGLRRLVTVEKPVGLVGLDGPIKEILEKLTDRQKSLKVVSIIGMEGLGKTTLAREIYAELQGKFDCQAFVSVGRTTSVRATLMDIAETASCGTLAISRSTEVITHLREWLDGKRYLIIIDGVWSTRDWKVINCALPDKNCGSRVLTTTCIMNVAKSCSVHPSDIHEMKALSRVRSEETFDGESAVLRQMDIFRAMSKSIFNGQPKRSVVDDILKVCGGMPLAIIVAAGLLSRKSTESSVQKMLGKSDFTSEGMNTILYMSYADLSVALKSCFMYLRVFPENYTIKKDRLIRLWRAEGFVPGNSWRTGESYFNELISRRLIQPVFGYEDDQAVGCTVHGVVLDFIASLSREENFVTAGEELKSPPLDADQMWSLAPFSYDAELPWSLMVTAGAGLTSGPFLCYETVRRLSLYGRGEGKGGNLVSCKVHLSRVQSLIAFGDSLGSLHLPDVLAFKLIRVLDLEDTNYVRTYRTIGNLFLLRYLGLAGTRVVREDIENIGKLNHLQTLDIRRTDVYELPSTMHSMPNLVSILSDGLRFSHPDSASLYQYVKNLEELSTMDVNDRITRDVITRLLVFSRKLKMLGVSTYGSSNREDVIRFLGQLKISNLVSLVMRADFHPPDEWAPSPKLRRFRLETSSPIPLVPDSWASLHNLTHLDIRVAQIEARDVLVLGRLPKLIVLKLKSPGRGRIGSTINSTEFQSLEVAWFNCPNGAMGLRYAHGAMPKLRRLRLECNLNEMIKTCDINFPSNLTHVDVTIKSQHHNPKNMELAESVIRDKISVHPTDSNLPLVFIQHVKPPNKPIGYKKRLTLRPSPSS